MKAKTTILLAAISVLTLSMAPAQASITFHFEAERILQGGTGTTPAQAGSLVLLVADTGTTSGAGTFNALQAGSISTGSLIDASHRDLVVAQFAISAGSIFTGNLPVLDVAPSLSLTGSWVAGNPLAIYWIPSLNSGATNVGATIAYGKYTDFTGINGSDPWVTPGDPSTANAMYFSTSGVYSGSTVPASTGYSSLSTIAVPEPSTYALVGGFLAFGAALLRRRKA